MSSSVTRYVTPAFSKIILILSLNLSELSNGKLSMTFVLYAQLKNARTSLKIPLMWFSPRGLISRASGLSSRIFGNFSTYSNSFSRRQRHISSCLYCTLCMTDNDESCGEALRNGACGLRQSYVLAGTDHKVHQSESRLSC